MEKLKNRQNPNEEMKKWKIEKQKKFDNSKDESNEKMETRKLKK